VRDLGHFFLDADCLIIGDLENMKVAPVLLFNFLQRLATKNDITPLETLSKLGQRGIGGKYRLQAVV